MTLDLSQLDLAKRRWRVGHHLFFALVQSLIVTCNQLDKHVAAGDVAAATREIERATQILWGVSVTFKLTGSFRQEAYDGYVRPNMFDSAEGFSGLWSHDHDFLVKKVLRRLKPHFANPAPEYKAAMQGFRQAFAVMYDSHKYVCDKFEGGQPSLLMGENAQRTAADMIDTFKQNRLAVLGEARAA